MQITISLPAAVAVCLWLVGGSLMTVAAFNVWYPGWIGIAPMLLGNAAWMQGRVRREANRLATREDAAFNFGKEAAIRSIH